MIFREYPFEYSNYELGQFNNELKLSIFKSELFYRKNHVFWEKYR
jgi:hypothetical protein